MKKLLLTIFVFAAIVACEKDAYDNDATSINVLEQAEEINASVDNSSKEEGLSLVKELFFSQNISQKINKKTASTARTSTVEDCHDNRPAGSNFIDAQAFPHPTISGQFWFVVRGTGDIPLRLNRNLVRIQIPSSASEDILLLLFVQDAQGNFGQPIELARIPYESSLADLVPLLAGQVDTDLVTAYGVSQTPTTYETPVDAGIDCAGALYEVTPAPFPLSGFLATILPGADLTSYGGSSANYAGTDRDAVIREIERDIRDGN